MARALDRYDVSTARRTAVAQWLTENGLDTKTVPADSVILIRDGANGRVIVHDQFLRDAIGQRYRTEVETPLTVEPPGAWPA